MRVICWCAPATSYPWPPLQPSIYIYFCPVTSFLEQICFFLSTANWLPLSPISFSISSTPSIDSVPSKTKEHETPNLCSLPFRTLVGQAGRQGVNVIVKDNTDAEEVQAQQRSNKGLRRRKMISLDAIYRAKGISWVKGSVCFVL